MTMHYLFRPWFRDSNGERDDLIHTSYHTYIQHWDKMSHSSVFLRWESFQVNTVSKCQGRFPDTVITIQGSSVKVTGLQLWQSPQYPGPRFNIKMSSYQFRKSHCGDKTIVRSSYLHNGTSYTGKMSSLYLIGAMEAISISDKMSYGKISQKLESVRLVSLWNSAARCLKISDQLENCARRSCTFDFLWDLTIRQFYTESLGETGRVHWNCQHFECQV